MIRKRDKYKEIRNYIRFLFSTSDNVFGELSFPEISGKMISSRLLDISAGGLQFTISRDQWGKDLCVESTLILHEVKGCPELKFVPQVTMDVRWIVDNPVFKNISVGCQFMDMPEIIRKKIDQYVGIKENAQEVIFCEECGYKNIVDSKVMAGIDKQPLICQNCNNLMSRETIITYSSSLNSTDSSKHHLLFIDDDLGYLQIITAMLQQEYQTTMAPTGKRGIELAETIMPDLILLDVNMPDMDGFGVCDRLQANSKTCDIPIIFVTANKPDNEEGLPPGVVDYITKPINQQMFHDKIKVLLKVKHLQGTHKQKVTELEQVIASLQKNHFEADIELETIRQEKLNLETILNTIESKIIIQDVEHKIVWANKNMLTTFKTTLAEITGKPCYTLFQDSGEACSDCPLSAGGISGYSKPTEVFNNSLQKLFSLSHVPLFDNDGELTGIVHLVKSS